MCDKPTEVIPQVSDNLIIDSDRVKAPVVGAGPMDSGEDQSHVRKAYSELKSMLDNLGKTTSDLQSVIKAIPNTKTEIKKAVGNIAFQLDVLKHKCTEWECDREVKTIESITKDISTGIQPVVVTNAEKKVSKRFQTKNIQPKGTSITQSVSENPSRKSVSTGMQSEDVHFKELSDIHVMVSRHTQTKKVGPEKGSDMQKLISLGVQTEEMCHEEDGDAVIDIVETLNNGNNYDDLTVILDKLWPLSVFKAVSVRQENPFKIASKQDIAIIIDPRDKGEKGILKDAISKYPEIKYLIEEGCIEGEIECIVNETKMSRKGDSEQQCMKRSVFLLPMKVDRDGVNSMEDVYLLMTHLRDILHSDKSIKNLAVVTPEGLDRAYVQKIMEFVLQKCGVKIEYNLPKSKRQPERQEFHDLKREKRSKDDVIIKAGEKSYADLLREVKHSVDIDKIGVKVERLRKTAAGDLQIIVDGGKQAAESLGAELRARLGGTKVIVKKATKIFHIWGIDAATTKEEVEESLRRVTGAKEGEITVSALRPTRDGNQAATITAQNCSIPALLGIDRIKVGWVTCRLRQRVSILRCFRCLETGHTSQKCKGPDCSRMCYNCGQEGHKAKDCTNSMYCIGCKIDGHKLDSMRCPRFKKVFQARVKRIQTEDTSD